jgi:hypothetical protein
VKGLHSLSVLTIKRIFSGNGAGCTIFPFYFIVFFFFLPSPLLPGRGPFIKKYRIASWVIGRGLGHWHAEQAFEMAKGWEKRKIDNMDYRNVW